MAVTRNQRQTDTVAQPAASRGDVAVLETRLNYPTADASALGIDRGKWKALVEAIYPSAKTPEAVLMALYYCKARELDPMKRPVHIVPMWDNVQKREVETIWPGISELRTTAHRTKQYAGCEDTVFGPTTVYEFSAEVEEWVERVKQKSQKTIEVEAPEWAQCTVIRLVNGVPCRFVGPRVYWMESYATRGKTDLPNEMWAERPIGQLDKCAEAAALRKAFPEELGNEYTAEEMQGRRMTGTEASAKPREISNYPDLPPEPPADKSPAARPETRAPAPQATTPKAADPAPVDRTTPHDQPAQPSIQDLLVQCDKTMARAGNLDELRAAWSPFWQTATAGVTWSQLTPDQRDQATQVLNRHKARVSQVARSTATDAEVIPPAKGEFSLQGFVAEIEAELAKNSTLQGVEEKYAELIDPKIEDGTLTEEMIESAIMPVLNHHRDRVEAADGPPAPPADDVFPGDQ